MDKELTNALGVISGQLATVSQDARTAAARSQEAAYGVTQLRGEIVEIRKDVDHLKAAVFGSDPPPNASSAIVRQVSEHDSELATLAGQVIATRSEIVELRGEVGTVKAQNTEQLEMLHTITKSVGGFLAHPMVRRIAWAAGGLLIAYANRGLVGLQ